MAQTANRSSELHERISGKIHPAAEIRPLNRILVWGKSGVGKTRVAASAPKVLLVDVNEQGTASVRRDLNPDVYLLDRWLDLNDIYWYLATGDHSYESVAIDGITGMQNLCMKFVLGDEASRDASRDPDMPSRQVWGKLGELMKTQITNFRNLPMNVIFTALSRTRISGEEGDEEEISYGPACSPSIAGHLEAAVDIIGHLTTREVQVKRKEADGSSKTTKVVRRRLLVGPHAQYMTKDRHGLFGQFIDNPNLSKVFKQIQEGNSGT